MNSRLLLFQPISNYIFGLHSYISDNFLWKRSSENGARGFRKWFTVEWRIRGYISIHWYVLNSFEFSKSLLWDNKFLQLYTQLLFSVAQCFYHICERNSKIFLCSRFHRKSRQKIFFACFSFLNLTRTCSGSTSIAVSRFSTKTVRQ